MVTTQNRSERGLFSSLQAPRWPRCKMVGWTGNLDSSPFKFEEIGSVQFNENGYWTGRIPFTLGGCAFPSSFTPSFAAGWEKTNQRGTI